MIPNLRTPQSRKRAFTRNTSHGGCKKNGKDRRKAGNIWWLQTAKAEFAVAGRCSKGIFWKYFFPLLNLYRGGSCIVRIFENSNLITQGRSQGGPGMPKILFCGRGMKCFSPLRGTNSKTTHCLPSYFCSLNALNGTVNYQWRPFETKRPKQLFWHLKCSTSITVFFRASFTRQVQYKYNLRVFQVVCGANLFSKRRNTISRYHLVRLSFLIFMF